MLFRSPCNSQLYPGIYGSAEGLLARVKSDHAFPSGSTGVAGYVLWLADATGLGSDATNFSPASIVGARFRDSTTAVTNTVAVPAFTDGVGVVGGGGFSLLDPAATLLSGGLARDARTISACMKIGYIGRMQDAAGQLAVIENLPVEEVLRGLTVDELFALSSNVKRIGVGTHEVKFRPSESSEYFRAIGAVGATYADGEPHDSAIETGSNLVPAITKVNAHNQGLRLFGFAWRGTGAPGTNLTMEFVKNIEWRPASDSGLPLTRPKTMYAVAPVAAAEHALDSRHQGWSFSEVVSGAGHIATQALTGAAKVAAPMIKGAATTYATSYLTELAGGALMLL